jgi:hypothetical protein
MVLSPSRLCWKMGAGCPLHDASKEPEKKILECER